MITYEQFISELPALIEQAHRLKDAEKRDDDPNFRRWRHTVTELIKEIKKAGYRVSCSIRARRFSGGPVNYRVNQSALMERYNRDVDDTIIELDTIIQNFKKFGVPKQDTGEIQLPEPGYVPTMREIFLALRAHHGWKTITVILAIIAVIFTAGLWVGRNF